MTLSIRSGFVGLFIASLLASTPLFASATEIGVSPTRDQKDASKVATRLLTRFHYKRTKLNDELSGLIFDKYLESLDPNRAFLLASDVADFSTARLQLDDALKRSDLAVPFAMFNLYSQRVRERVSHAKSLLGTDWDFEKDEVYQYDRSEADWAENQERSDEIWHKRVKNDVLNLRLAGKESKEISETLGRRYDNLARRIDEIDSERVFQLFMNSFGASIEPHTAYMSPRASENFHISMRLSLEGIGAVLQRENELTSVRRVVPGGPADKMGEVKAGDRIIAVGQGEKESMVNVVGWRLDDVVDLIRGAKGTVVRLEVLPQGESVGSPSNLVSIVRDKVKLEEQAAQKSILEWNLEGQTHKIGVIDVPAFYLDFAGRARNLPDYRSTTRDVRKLIVELKEAKVDGIVIDLRNNGGGSLLEATDLTGLFIDQGPVVQVKNQRGRVDVKSDTDPGVFYDGPLAVLVNRNSASASEIFAAAIQDYGRGAIIGERTFGKGTVQDLIDLDRYSGKDKPRLGQLRLTMAQFFRVNGGSTQHKGVTPDIKFPSVTLHGEFGESAYKNALPWSTIPEAKYTAYGAVELAVNYANLRYQQRLSKDREFGYLLVDISDYENDQENLTISLKESARKSDRDERDKKRDARKAEREVAENEQTTVDGHISVVSFSEPPDPDDIAMTEAETALVEEEGEDGPDVPDIFLNESARILADIIVFGQNTQRTAQSATKKEALEAPL